MLGSRTVLFPLFYKGRRARAAASLRALAKGVSGAGPVMPRRFKNAASVTVVKLPQFRSISEI